MDLLALADFNLIASHGGLGRASRATGKSKATLSRRVVALETDLGVRLVERGTQSLKLTEAGATLYARTEGLLDEIFEAGQAIGANMAQPRGRLRVSAPLFFAHTYSGKIAARFTKIYPDVQLEITAEDRRVDLIEEGYDVVVRVNPEPTDLLIGRCLMRSDVLLVAAPSLIGGIYLIPGGALRLPAVTLNTSSSDEVWRIKENSTLRIYRPQQILRLSSALIIRDAVIEGAGFALLPSSLVEADVLVGRLVCHGVSEEPQRTIWALHSSRRFVSNKVKVFLRYLEEVFPTE
ncbi:MAG: LysR family transcriptional regulator [Janthinobacterium lividum]